MASLNAVYPPEIWAMESLMVLQNTHVMPNLVHRDFENEVAEKGDVVHTRKPSKFVVNDLSADGELQVQNPASDLVSVTLDQHIEVTFRITSRDMDTAVKNLVEEFMEPALIPKAERVDSDLLGAAGGLTDSSFNTVTIATTLANTDLVNVRTQLRSQQCPFRGANGVSPVNLVMGVQHEGEALLIDKITDANVSGLSVPPVLTGYIGAAYGMNVFADQTVPTGASSAIDQSVAFHKNSIALVTRPLDNPGGEFGVRAAVVEKDGIGIRVVMSWQHLRLAWIISLDLLYGFQILDTNLGVILSD